MIGCMEGVALCRMIYSTMVWNMHGTYGGTNDDRKENKTDRTQMCDGKGTSRHMWS